MPSPVSSIDRPARNRRNLREKMERLSYDPDWRRIAKMTKNEKKIENKIFEHNVRKMF